MHPSDKAVLLETRRQFFGRGARGLGVAALASLFGEGASAKEGLPGLPHFAPKAKRAIYLHMVGGPSQLDLYDYKPVMKAWFDKDLPTFVVLNATHTHPKAGVQAISAKLWSAGFLSAKYAGVALRSKGDPVLYIGNPDGVDGAVRRRMLDALGELNQLQYQEVGDPETQARVAQFAMAFRMQSSVPELTDLSKEPASTYKLYRYDAHNDATLANTCVMARRLIERGVRFMQVYHRGWDQHALLPETLAAQCKDVDRGCFGLVQDLQSPGLLSPPLVIWAREFPPPSHSQGNL